MLSFLKILNQDIPILSLVLEIKPKALVRQVEGNNDLDS